MGWKAILVVLAIIPAVVIVALAILSATARKPDNLGVRDGKLAPCPITPNCVSSQADDFHHMDAIPFDGNPGVALNRLEAILAARPRTAVVKKTYRNYFYLRVECTSFIFRFVDDLEFVLDADAKVIHFRSAARVGYGDLGVNRARMQEIRNAFLQ